MSAVDYYFLMAISTYRKKTVTVKKLSKNMSNKNKKITFQNLELHLKNYILKISYFENKI